ncbi:MAG TPA: cytochrome c oxidase accessory protein CcoG [Candidatus Dormibacteraeota bacterium]|nr:cytochrome c oxidase accessory protein CcoG [Candidatus Dormibacteraeota bacterium]
MNAPAKTTTEAASPVRPVDWEDFRDHLATADKEGRRMWLHPRKPHGRYYRARTYLSWLLLGVMFIGPFIRIQGKPLLLLNFIARKFVILGQVFWPQDMFISAVTLLIFFTGIIVFTAAFGRLWCGWTCPQTVLMEMVFRKIEYAIEGDAPAQRELARARWSASKITKKFSKHAIFLILSFIVGNTLLAYIIGTEQLFKIVSDNPAHHLQGLSFMVLFTLVFYAIFARFREQACTFICPYGRLQSTVLDENSIVVAYDYKRGENRGTFRRDQTVEQRKTAGLGDCIECHQCVNVCPTGIDIRYGTQMECVHCTACIDACDSVMDKIGRPKGLIRYASLNGIERGERLRFTPRLAGYTVLLVALIGFWTFLVFTRSDVQTTLLRAPGSLFQKMPDGRFSNLYTIKVVNKTTREIPIELKLENTRGTLQVMGSDLVAPPAQLAETSALIELSSADMKPGCTSIVVGIYSNGRKLETLKTCFIGP